uniref:Uncharacterized protein n=1 Tax=Arundo donax TaxID=35708 RepID=A0A0A9D954_ARUDO
MHAIYFNSYTYMIEEMHAIDFHLDDMIQSCSYSPSYYLPAALAAVPPAAPPLCPSFPYYSCCHSSSGTFFLLSGGLSCGCMSENGSKAHSRRCLLV